MQSFELVTIGLKVVTKGLKVSNQINRRKEFDVYYLHQSNMQKEWHLTLVTPKKWNQCWLETVEIRLANWYFKYKSEVNNWIRRLGNHTLIGSTEFISFQRGIRCLSCLFYSITVDEKAWCNLCFITLFGKGSNNFFHFSHST